MLELTENTLGKRQCELNSKVQEAYNSKVNFDEIKLKEEKSDIDILFKIDLASLYKNIDYISDILKSGDSLYITRALKCTWLYDDEFKYFINPDNLHCNIFPYMSIKMKKKTLVTIAANITNAETAHEFNKYCSNMQLDNIAFNYLIKCSETVKSEFIKEHLHINDTLMWEHFFGNSMDLIKLYIEKKQSAVICVDQDLYNFRYLFSSSPEIYLNLLETYTARPDQPFLYTYYNHRGRFGLRMSKEIMVRHKRRVLEKPWLYLQKLNWKLITRHCIIDDAKKIVIDMLPDEAYNFWNMNFYNKYIDFFNLLPPNERYPFLKKIFTEKYSLDTFEMSIEFYRFKYYELLTNEERHVWALEHLNQKKELLGEGRDFLWYKFVNFDKAFIDIKKLIFTTTCPDKRSDMLGVLVDSASELTQMEKLLSYYYERHVNESSHNKGNFIDKIIELHNIFEFTENVWDPFYKLLLSLNFTTCYQSDKLTHIVIVYNIIHNNTIPEKLEPYCVYKGRSYLFTTHLEKLTVKQRELVYSTFMDFFVGKIKGLTDDEKNKNTKDIIEHVHSILTMMQSFDKTVDDCPKEVLNFIDSHLDEFKYYNWFQTKEETLNEAILLGLLKKDKMALVNKLPAIKQYPHSYKRLNLKRLFQKLKIYFYNDIRLTVLAYFEKWLAEKSENKWLSDYDKICFALFQLADDSYKINFMAKYAPTEPKIKHDVIDENVLKIQESICRFAYYSRPPVPLDSMLQYVKGDYVHFCLPMFNSYLANLPLPQSLKFTESILNAPLSIQKHGLRLAFVNYSTDNLKQLVLGLWRKTKNVSLRAIIYKSLFEKIKKGKEAVQIELYAILKILTLELTEDDQEEVFELMYSASLPGNLRGKYLLITWKSVQNLPDHSSTNINRKIRIIQNLDSYIDQIDREFCWNEVIDKHIQNQLVKKEILHFNNNNGYNSLIDEKWNLTAQYITHYNNEIQQNDSCNLLDIIMKNCMVMWNEIRDGKYSVRAFLYNFVYKVMSKTDYKYDMKNKPYIVPIYEKILEFLTQTCPLKEIYRIVLMLQFEVLGRNSIGLGEFNTNIQEITYDHLTETEVSHKYSKAIVELINDLIARKQLFYSFYSDIASIISDTISKMISWTKLNSDSLKMKLCLALLEFNCKEAYMLVLHLLPAEVDGKYKDCQTNIIHKLNECSDEEVQTFMYHKFILPNFTSTF